MSFAAEYFGRLAAALREMPEVPMERALRWLLEAHGAGRQILVMGNGGSAATASHFACDVGKGVGLGLSRKFRILALHDNMPLLTACANDASYDDTLRIPLENLLQPGDLVLGLSTSGESRNVLRAFELAQSRGNRTVAFTARPGGRLARLADCAVVVPTEDVQLAEDMHHSLCHMLMRRLCLELGVEPSGKPRG